MKIKINGKSFGTSGSQDIGVLKQGYDKTFTVSVTEDEFIDLSAKLYGIRIKGTNRKPDSFNIEFEYDERNTGKFEGCQVTSIKDEVETDPNSKILVSFKYDDAIFYKNATEFEFESVDIEVPIGYRLVRTSMESGVLFTYEKIKGENEYEIGDTVYVDDDNNRVIKTRVTDIYVDGIKAYVDGREMPFTKGFFSKSFIYVDATEQADEFLMSINNNG